MNWFSMLFQIAFFRKVLVTILLCFVTSCHHENDWHVFPKCLFQKNLNHKLGNCVTYYLNEQIQDVFTTHFFENKHDHRQKPFSTFFDMNWFSMIFQIDFFRKIIVTILSCFLTSCPHKNDWHVFPNCLFQKNLNHKLGNCVTYCLNEQFQDVFTTHFFENKHVT